MLSAQYIPSLELAEMDVQKEEVQKLEMELSKVEGNLEQEKTKSEGVISSCTQSILCATIIC